MGVLHACGGRDKPAVTVVGDTVLAGCWSRAHPRLFAGVSMKAYSVSVRSHLPLSTPFTGKEEGIAGELGRPGVGEAGPSCVCTTVGFGHTAASLFCSRLT